MQRAVTGISSWPKQLRHTYMRMIARAPRPVGTVGMQGMRVSTGVRLYMCIKLVTRNTHKHTTTHVRHCDCARSGYRLNPNCTGLAGRREQSTTQHNLCASCSVHVLSCVAVVSVCFRAPHTPNSASMLPCYHVVSALPAYNPRACARGTMWRPRVR